MKIQTKLVLLLGVMALVMALLYSGIALWRICQNAERNTADIRAVIRLNLEREIWHKAHDIARQVEIYLEAHPFDRRDARLREIAVQKIQHTGYSGLHDGIGQDDGRYVFHLNRAMEGKELSAFKTKLPVLWAAIRVGLQGRETSRYYLWEDGGRYREKFFVGVPVKGTDCILFATVYVDEFYGPLRAAERAIRAELLLTIRLLLGSALVLTLAMAGASILLARRISRPVCELTARARAIGQGNLDEKIPVRSRDELGELAEVLNKMSADLKAYIENLRKTTAAKERMEGELSAAHNIQQSLLPHVFPPFPQVREIDLFATMTPAREVGGDFYDFFLVEPGRLGFIVGDVSGKGVPAALFMAIAGTLLRSFALSRLPPAEIMARASAELAQENEARMFVTAIYGEYDMRSGKLVLVSAGHNRPVIIRAGVPAYVALPSNIPLGTGFERAYAGQELDIAPGDVLFLYTDGVPEAQDERGDFYGDARLLSALVSLGKSNNPKDLCESVRLEMQRFTGGAEAADDLTLLALKINALK